MYALEQPASPAIHSFALQRDSNMLLVERAEQRLRSNAYLALKNITCEFRQGTLVLRGQLPTYYLKQVASAAVADLDGVEQVINQIEVVSSPRILIPTFLSPRFLCVLCGLCG